MAGITDLITNINYNLSKRSNINNILPGSIIYSLNESYAYELDNLQSYVDNIEITNSIIMATGTDLDAIGQKYFGIKRRGSIQPFISSSMQNLMFYVQSGTFGDINNGADIIIPKGTSIDGWSNTNYWRFVLDQPVTLVAGDSQFFISASLLTGIHDNIPANVITSHGFRDYTQSSMNTLLVTNTSVVSTGRPDETDDNFRYRIVNYLKSLPGSNVQGIHDNLTAISGVSDVIISPASNGGGTLTVIVQSISPICGDETINAVKVALGELVPPWITYNVVKPSYIGLSLTINVSFNNQSKYTGNPSIGNQISNAVSNYINNTNSGQFYINSIIPTVMSVNQDIVGVTLTSASRYSGPMTIARQQNTIDITNDNNLYINASSTDKIIVEPITKAITVNY